MPTSSDLTNIVINGGDVLTVSDYSEDNDFNNDIARIDGLLDAGHHHNDTTRWQHKCWAEGNATNGQLPRNKLSKRIELRGYEGRPQPIRQVILLNGIIDETTQ